MSKVGTRSYTLSASIGANEPKYLTNAIVSKMFDKGDGVRWRLREDWQLFFLCDVSG